MVLYIFSFSISEKCDFLPVSASESYWKIVRSLPHLFPIHTHPKNCFLQPQSNLTIQKYISVYRYSMIPNGYFKCIFLFMNISNLKTELIIGS
jgi:hypothetical protein